jgi:hypothetical protein
VAGALAEAAAPPRAGDASDYAGALLELLDAYDALEPGAVRPGVERLADALDRLVARAGGRRGGTAAVAALDALISDAYEWRAARLVAAGRLHERDALLQGYLGLVGEGFVAPGRWAALAAAELATTAYDAGAVVEAGWYARRALGWAPTSPDARTTDALVSAVDVLVSVGRLEDAIALATPLVSRLDRPRAVSAATAVTLCCALARAHSDLGEHSFAIEHAATATDRARRTWGAHSFTTRVCEALLDDCLARAVANR